MLFQLPVTAETWQPLSPSQFQNSASSAPLVIPSVASQGGNVTKGTVIYVAFMQAVAQVQWIRFDGADAVVGACTQMNPQDSFLIYGLNCLKAVRVVRAAPGGGLAVSYFYYRQEMS